ncbi:sensor histidine kinase [Candidatus Nitronereus thalassa]|uniref:histidine kinase n=1 Tax=Candidatus Nitronereus thalassa TaxID=3020898 RepID=A0ABU3K778_9BACT|nr:ATP-binding protein [Candidatus Nitronereus thalassa]MDT7042215.1 ATP-binding protein [Candidatus Nitronereus thalassa]
MIDQSIIRVLVLGGGQGGTALLELFFQLPHIQIVGIVDTNPHAPGLLKAKQLHIPVFSNYMQLNNQKDVDLIVDVTGDPEVSKFLRQQRNPTTEILDGATAKLFWEILGHEKQMEGCLLQTEKLASIGTFVSSIAHDVNNPLYMILGHGQNIAEDTEEQSTKESAQCIVAATKRITKICRGLTLYSRAPSPEKMEMVHVNSQLDEAWNIASFAANHQDVIIEKHYDCSAAIQANQDDILQVLVNLIVNALHAMEGVGVLTLASVCQNGSVTLHIADTGSGIPENHLPNLFLPFFTTKPKGMGTGLGLYSAKSITEKYGGQICVESEVGKGTAFSLQFPAIEHAPT